MRTRTRFFIILLAALLAALPARAQSIPADKSAAVILAYYRIGEDAYPGSNLRVEQFREQMKELSSPAYHVLPLPDILAAWKEGRALPDRTVAITFEGGYQSFLQNALPVLTEFNFPFTVFFAPESAEGRSDQYMSWNDLKNLSQNKLASLGLLPSAGTPLEGVNRAKTRAREELGAPPVLFSYPYGEYDSAYKSLIKEQGFAAAFGLQSGVVWAGADMYALPRFTMTESYGDLDRFRMVVNALPLPARDVQPESPVLKEASPLIGFSLDDSLKDRAGALSCFISGDPNLKTETLGDARVELRLSGPLLEERARVNCTIPVAAEGEDSARWRWFGMMLVNAVDAVEDEESETAQP